MSRRRKGEISAFIVFALLLVSACSKEKIIPVQPTPVPLNETCTLRDIEFFNDTLGFICGGNPGEYGVILRTIDAGLSWTLVYQSSSHCIYDAAFFDIRNGYAGGDRLLLLHTVDGGDHWSNVYQNTSFDNWTDFIKPIRKILYPSSTTVLAVGGDDWDKGLMCISHNWGADWFFHDFPNQLNDMARCGTQTVWSCGYGITLCSADSCSTNESHRIAEENFSGIDFLDAATGLACAFNGNIYRTSDGGLNWSRVRKSNSTLSNKNHLNDIRFIDSQRAIAVGSGGLILFSNDGGTNWQTAQTDIGNDLYAVAVHPGLWICGSQGLLARITL